MEQPQTTTTQQPTQQPQQFQRQVAYKIWISNLNNCIFHTPQKKEGEFIPSYAEYKDKKISRINIIATVVDYYRSEDGNYISTTLDDGSSTIRLKAFNDDAKILENLKKGDTIITISRVKEYQGELYLIPEIIKKVENYNLEIIRKSELLKNIGKPEIEKPRTINPQNQTPTQESNIIPKIATEKDPKHEELRNKIISKISENEEEGAKLSEISTSLEIEQEITTKIVRELLLEGEIYENKPDHFKAL